MAIIVLKFVLLIIGGYMLGNFSSAKFISKLKKDDITKHGSGNPGTMNMVRTFGFKLGFLTLVMDALKSAIPSLVGFAIFGGFSGGGDMAYIALFAGGFAAVLGHIFPIVYKFKGGKGIACIVGMFAVAEPMWAGIIFAVSLLFLIIVKYGALTSFVFITCLTVIEGYKFRHNIVVCILLFLIYFLAWYMHRQNFFRLLIGKENKVNLFKKKKDKEKLDRQTKKEIKQENKNKEIG
ncbi:MAG: glycerol-3-phosphate acyltransferase [Clostridiales bacterium]|nr:glycerol-3-phosphate acyltransferase [Clostridiales bacterium]